MSRVVTWRMGPDQYARFNVALERQAVRRCRGESPPMDPTAYELMMWSWMRVSEPDAEGVVDVIAHTNESGLMTQ